MRWLTSEGIPGTIIGGVAVSIRGKPRHTDDVDAVILGDDIGWDRVVESAARYGLVPRIENALGFAARSRMLLFRHAASKVEIDVSLGVLPFERETIERSTIVRLGALELRLSSAEDLVIMKALARRPRDIADIEGILDVHRDLDLDRIRRHLREFSSLLEMPEIHDDFERLLRQKQKGQA
jgi:predicted nucleotidyltransferase